MSTDNELHPIIKALDEANLDDFKPYEKLVQPTLKKPSTKGFKVVVFELLEKDEILHYPAVVKPCSYSFMKEPQKKLYHLVASRLFIWFLKFTIVEEANQNSCDDATEIAEASLNKTPMQGIVY
jgi:hypothetical protein